MRKLIPILSLTVAAMAILAGCGDKKSDDADTAAQTGKKAPISVVMKDFSFEPSTITVSAPGTYTFDAVNEGDTAHAIRIEGNGLDESGDTVGPGETSSVTVELEAGEYELDCPVGNHEDLGMKGTITVSGASPASDTGHNPQTGEGYVR